MKHHTNQYKGSTLGKIIWLKCISMQCNNTAQIVPAYDSNKKETRKFYKQYLSTQNKNSTQIATLKF